MSDWKEYKLGEIVTLQTAKVSVNEIPLDDYVSTENMVADKGGIIRASSIPEMGSITKYSKDNTLISNIRPYFKKIWFADRDGGCSNDVLCFVGNQDLLNNRFLYYLLSQDTFFDFVMLGSKGCKMPRGDKSHIMNWNILLPSLPEQERIAGILSSLDDKIDLLNKQNTTLESLAETLFRQWFIENPNPEWKESPISKIATFTNGLPCQKFPCKNEIDKLPVLKIKELSNGVSENSDWVASDINPEYIVNNGDVIFSWSASLMVKIWNGEKCVLNQHLFKLTSDIYPKWFYYHWCKHHLQEFISIATSHATTMGHIRRKDLDEALTLIPSKIELDIMTHKQMPIIQKIIENNKQIYTIQKLRNDLLTREIKY